MFKKIETVFCTQKKKLFTGLGSVRIVKNCDLGLENAALGPRSQFFTIRTSQPANNIYRCTWLGMFLGENRLNYMNNIHVLSYENLPGVRAGVHSNTKEYMEPSNNDWISPRQNTLGSDKKTDVDGNLSRLAR